jgi:hypothetical protein
LIDEKITDRRIIELMLNGNEFTVGDIAKQLGTEEKLSGVTYHMKNLAAGNIVLVKEKKHGTTYRLNPKYTTPPYYVITAFTVSIVFLAFGVSLFWINSLVAATIFLSSSAIIGAVTSFFNFINKTQEKIKYLLESI